MPNITWEKLQENLPKGTLREKKSYNDERYWKLARNENNTGSAIIRLLPDQDMIPFVKVFSHSIEKKIPGSEKSRWFIEDSPYTIGQPCPASEKWQELMKIGTPEAKEAAKLIKRRARFITNILVVKDTLNPENNGKVFLWEFGVKLSDKFIAAMNPSEEDIELGAKPKQLFDPINGCNILLKIKKGTSGYFDYDDTQILPESSVVETEEEAKELISRTYKLSEYLSPDHYLSYDELKIKLNKVLYGEEPKSVTESVTEKKSKKKETLIDEEPSITESTSEQEDDDEIDEELKSFFDELED